jgi:hypothetical protein
VNDKTWPPMSKECSMPMMLRNIKQPMHVVCLGGKTPQRSPSHSDLPAADAQRTLLTWASRHIQHNHKHNCRRV